MTQTIIFILICIDFTLTADEMAQIATMNQHDTGTINFGATTDMIPGITEGTICYPAGYMDLKPEDITEILKESI